ncbi:MAG: PPOX class F420-dependent oxidoreductase [Actinobacteria bacterium]|nr:PPOX class F420-dependent oxidoreductase [Actinomycetota bacterium]
MDLSRAMTWARTRQHAALITIRRDGRPQSSDITYAIDGGDFLISVTESRAKTTNMRRDPRVVLHLSDPSAWSYLSFDGTVELSPVTTSSTDETSNQLVSYFETVTGSAHPDWDEYRQAMINEARLIARFKPSSVVGQLN